MECNLVVSCEHAGNNVPQGFQSIFEGHEEVLSSHKGWDPGAWIIAQEIAKHFSVVPLGEHTTRLLIETNRSLHHPELYSSYSQGLSAIEKDRLLHEIYLPYRTSVENEIRKIIKPALHLSIHTFTPVFNGLERSVDIGILFDPERNMESTFSKLLLNALKVKLPAMSSRFNEPYLGVDDGFTTHLRKLHPDDHYIGIEIEVSQKFLGDLHFIVSGLVQALKTVVTTRS
ncbi:MAG: N-formylglutamate amidohydrolase [Cyclobacteriaceae bacterium]